METRSQTESYRDSPETEFLKEWQWVQKLPGYGGEYSNRIIEMSQEFQQAINLEIKAKRILSGLEEGRDKTLDVTPEDRKQANELQQQALDLRQETVVESRVLLKNIQDRWKPEDIERARQLCIIDRIPVQTLTRDRDR